MKINEYVKEIEEIAAKCSCRQSDGYAQIMRICDAIKEEQENEKETRIKNHALLQEHLSELRADLEDFNDEDLLEYRECMLKRVNECLKVIPKTNKNDLE